MFGETWHVPPLFYSRREALRFELATGSHAIDRMLSALDRASEVAKFALEGAGELLLVAVLYQEQAEREIEGTLKLINDLEACGLPRPDEGNRRAFRSSEAHADEFSYQLWAPIQQDQLGRALWASISCDLGIAPSVTAKLFVVCPDRGILLHAYDDRGMDVIGTSVEVLRPLYEKFNDWLLDYDRKEMDKVFG